MEEFDVTRFRGLNMNHGFIRSIVKNQIDRDEYHKIIEERKTELQEKVKRSKGRYEAQTQSSLYVPPHRRSDSRSTSERGETAKRSQIGPSVISNTEEHTIRKKLRSRIKASLEDVEDLELPASPRTGKLNNSVKQIFTLNMKNNEGEKVEIPVFSTDSAARLSKEIGRKYGFTEEQCRMLRLTLEQGLETHLAKD